VLPAITRPEFSLPAILSTTPVFIFLIVLQANLPSVRYLQGQGYQPPTFVLGMVSGLGTLLGSLLGPTGISLSLPVTSLVSGPEAGVREIRHRSVIMASGAALLVGALAGFAARLPEVLPRGLLVTLAGLALIDVLGGSLRRIGQSPLRLGPLLAFAVSLSDISLLGFGAFFWALVIGTAVSLLVEREAVRDLREEEGEAKSG
jgi:benzoate membrane transport protein